MKQSHSKNLRKMVSDIAGLMSKLQVSEKEAEFVHKYNSECTVEKKL
jgi:hypothetical protein